jgi:hypothetical protein
MRVERQCLLCGHKWLNGTFICERCEERDRGITCPGEKKRPAFAVTKRKAPMPVSADFMARITRAAQAAREACARENLSFVLVVEPFDVPTGVFVATDENDDEYRTVNKAREMLAGAVERLSHSRYAVIKTEGTKP